MTVCLSPTSARYRFAYLLIHVYALDVPPAACQRYALASISTHAGCA